MLLEKAVLTPGNHTIFVGLSFLPTPQLFKLLGRPSKTAIYLSIFPSIISLFPLLQLGHCIDFEAIKWQMYIK